MGEKEVKKMEKIAIISDVHGNLVALEAVLEDIKQRGISKIFCLGDTVLKNSEPHECLKLVREHCSLILKGNTDQVVATLEENKEEHIWNHDRLTAEEREFLRNLPISYDMYISGHFIRFLHASPSKLNHIMNISNPNNGNITYEEMFQNTPFIGKESTDPIPDIVFYGHTHTCGIGRYGNKQLVNVGPVGCAVEMLNEDENDEKNKLTTMAHYCVIEGNTGLKELGALSITFVKVPYSIEKQISVLTQSDVPNKDLALREIRTGIYKRR